MGLFSSKKTYVSSVIYNLAGDEAERPNFLKTAVISHTMLGRRPYISESLKEAYMYGPGMKLRSFFRWARANYSYIGMPSASLNSMPQIDIEVVKDNVPHTPGTFVNVYHADLGPADFAYWAEQWMLLNYVNLIDTEWTSDYLETTGEIQITFEDLSMARFIPANFVKNAQYLYVTYNEYSQPPYGGLVTGSTSEIGAGGAFPSTAGWTTVSSVTMPKSVTLNKLVTTVTSYSDGRPTTTTTVPSSTSQAYTEYVGNFTRVVYLGEDPINDALEERTDYMFQQQYAVVTEGTTSNTVTDTIEGTVTRTTVTTTKQDSFAYGRRHRTDYKERARKVWGPTRGYIYRIGSGNAAQDILSSTSSGGVGEYFPFIPARLDNKFLSPSYLPTGYNLADKAFKKAFGRNRGINDIIESLQDSDNLADIDYAYVFFGVSLNVKENACRKYLYLLFDKFRQNRTINRPGWGSFGGAQSAYENITELWGDWRSDQNDSGSLSFGDTEPSVPVYSSTPTNNIRIKSAGSLPSNLDISISWNEIKQVSGSGLGKPGAKKGDYWFDTSPPVQYQFTLYTGKGKKVKANAAKKEVLRLYWQRTATSWVALDIIGLVHRNYIYKGKFVETWGSEAFTEAEDSGFVIPLHYPTFKEMSIKDSTQMSTACAFLMINCYLVKKTGFLGSFFFKILMVVAVIAITVLTGGVGATSLGILGTNAAVGAAIGLSGLAAVVVGAIANAVAAMIVMKLVTTFSTAVFGDKFGQIIGVVLSFVAISMATSFTSTGSFAMNWSQLMRVDNIINLTASVGNAYANVLGQKAQDTFAKTQALVEDYGKKSQEIEDLYAKNIGYGMGVINPMDLVDAGNFYVESGDSFLTRTLMTGSDIIDIQMSMISDYSDLTLTTSLNF